MVGIVAGGGRIDKPFLKAGRKYHAMRAKRNSWPRKSCPLASPRLPSLHHIFPLFDGVGSNGVFGTTLTAGSRYSWCGDEPC